MFHLPECISVVKKCPIKKNSKFLYLWTGKFSNNTLVSDINSFNISISNKDFNTVYIPSTTNATFAVPDSKSFIDADKIDQFWFKNNVLQQKTFADLISSTTCRTFIKYTNSEPYNISIIGILNKDVVLTEKDKIEMNSYFQLWCEYWGELMDSGYMKDNRTI